MVKVSRVSSSGVSTIRTSLHLEMSLLSAGRLGVARMWTFPPPRTGMVATAESMQDDQEVSDKLEEATLIAAQ